VALLFRGVLMMWTRKISRDEPYADNFRSADNKGFEKNPSSDISSEEFDDIAF